MDVGVGTKGGVVQLFPVGVGRKQGGVGIEPNPIRTPYSVLRVSVA